MKIPSMGFIFLIALLLTISLTIFLGYNPEKKYYAKNITFIGTDEVGLYYNIDNASEVWAKNNSEIPYRVRLVGDRYVSLK